MSDYEVFEAWANRFDHDSREWEDMGRDTVFIAGMNAARSTKPSKTVTLTVDTREDDATLAEKVRVALKLTGGHAVQLSASNDLSGSGEAEASGNALGTDMTKRDQLRVFRDLLMGADLEDVKQDYELEDIEYGEAIEAGLALTNEVLGLSLDPLAMEASFYCDGGKDTWVYRAMLAIEQLRTKTDKPQH